MKNLTSSTDLNDNSGCLKSSWRKLQFVKHLRTAVQDGKKTTLTAAAVCVTGVRTVALRITLVPAFAKTNNN